MSARPAPRSTALGMAAMTAGMALFAINDALVKAAASGLPLAPTLALRGLFATAAVGAFILAVRPHAPLAGFFHPLVVVRSLSEVLGIFCLFAALLRLPIGDVTAVSQSMPLILLPAAAVFLKERVAPVQWLLVLVGFLGIVLIAKPLGAGFDPTIGLVLGATLSFAFRDLTARRLPATITPTAVTLSTVVVSMLAAAAIAPFQGIQPMTGAQVGMLALAGLFLAGGQAAVFLAFRFAPVSEVAPFNYTKTAFAVLIGMIAFAERPDVLTVCGIVLVVGSGIAIALGLGRRAS